MVTNISGKHHLITFLSDKKPAIHIFDQKLQLVSQREINFRFKKQQVVHVIPFKEHYFIYVHQPAGENVIWRIDEDGKAVELSAALKGFIDSTLKKRITNIEISNNQDELFITSNIYYPEVETVVSTVAQMDKDLKVVSTNKLAFPYKASDRLKQVELHGKDLFLLKRSVDSAGYTLHLMKGDRATGKITRCSFSSNVDYTLAAFNNNSSDSSITLYSIVRNDIFLTKVNNNLEEIVPVSLVKGQFRGRVASTFFSVPGMKESIETTLPLFSTQYTRPYREPLLPTVDAIANEPSAFQRMYETNDQYAQRLFRETNINNRSNSDSRLRQNRQLTPSFPVRISVLDNQFKLINSRIISAEEEDKRIETSSVANVQLKGKNFYIFAQHFPGKKQGLLAVTNNEQNEFTTSDIRVFEKYNFLLQQVQAVDYEYILLPYTHKRMMGLVKITLN
ncbi:hypothetical protein [Aridibaculum aurantiacum]|uniref:hypothetical protein n=1 Tax=Aridibaculum aurantiacum TaxID=2810307 RepID=UPI001A9778E4|nr:hypothetical protein [Aridibaculum aurantiacum]